MRWFVALLAVLMAVSSSYAIGMYVPEGVASSQVLTVGQERQFPLTVKNDGTQKTVEIYAKSESGVVSAEPVTTVTLGPYESKGVVVRVKGMKDGKDVVRYGYRDITATSGFGMQLANERRISFTVGTGVNSSSSSSSGSSRGSGGGGGSGGASPLVQKNSSCNGKFVAENGKWVCVPFVNATVTVPVAPVQKPVVPQEGSIVDVSAGEGGIAQGIVDVATGNVAPIVDVVEDAAPVVVDAAAKNWHIAVIICMGVLLASSLAVVLMMRGGSYA